MARTYAGLGSDALVPQLKKTAIATLKLSSDEGFVLSRVDGKSTVAQIVLLVPFEPKLTAAMLARLVRAGAIDLPGHEVSLSAPPPPSPPVVPVTSATAPPPPFKSARARINTPVIVGLELTPEQARRIDEFFDSLEERDAFQLLEVARGADKKEIKRAYFKMSKEFHPDRFFNKTLGPYKERLSKIFQSIKAAFELLTDDTRRAAYEESHK